MFPKQHHSAGMPKESTPPAALEELVDQGQLPKPVIRHGLTSTAGGEWALLVSVPSTTNVPIPAVEQAARGFPVVYVAEPDEPVRAY